MSAQSNGRDGGSSGGGVSFSFSYKELIATGLAGALLAFLALALKASPILIGALSPMASTVIMAIVKAYSSGAALGGPRLPGILYILGAFWWFASRESGVRQAILLAGLRAGLVSTVISVSVVGGTAAAAHQVAHKDLPCLVWQIGCNHHIQHKQQPSGGSPDASRGGPYTGDLDGGKYALVATSLLLGSGILSAAILRRR